MLRLHTVSDVISSTANVISHWIEGWARLQDQSVLQAFDVSLLAFARWSEADDNPSWIIQGTKAFRSDGTSYKLSPSYIARVGYNASLKCCTSGLILTSEISVSCFLQGGRLIDFIAAIGNYSSPEDVARNCDERYGLSKQLMCRLDDLLKNCKIKTIHLGHTKKMKGFGKCCNNVVNQRCNINEKFIRASCHTPRLRISFGRWNYGNRCPIL